MKLKLKLNKKKIKKNKKITGMHAPGIILFTNQQDRATDRQTNNAGQFASLLNCMALHVLLKL